MRRAPPEARVLTELGRKRCGHCKQVQPHDAFGSSKTSGDGFSVYCRDCEWRRALMRNCGITGEEYAVVLREQNGKCGLCRVTECRSGLRFAVDHDHACCPGRDRQTPCGYCTRGLLCRDCNGTRLPVYEKAPEHLRDSPTFNAYLIRRPIQALRPTGLTRHLSGSDRPPGGSDG